MFETEKLHIFRQSTESKNLFSNMYSGMICLKFARESLKITACSYFLVRAFCIFKTNAIYW